MRLPETCHTGLLYIPAPRRTSSGDVVEVEIHTIFLYIDTTCRAQFFFVTAACRLKEIVI